MLMCSGFNTDYMSSEPLKTHVMLHISQKTNITFSTLATSTDSISTCTIVSSTSFPAMTNLGCKSVNVFCITPTCDAAESSFSSPTSYRLFTFITSLNNQNQPISERISD